MFNIIKKIKKNGVMWFFKAVLYLIYVKNISIFVKKDLNEIDIIKAKIDVKFDFVKENIVSELMKSRNLFNKDDVEKFYINGAKCLGALDGDRLIGYTWAHFDGYYFPFFKYYLEVGEKEVFIGPDWVDPEFRGNLLHSALLSHIFMKLKEDGWLYVYGNVGKMNKASIKGLEKVGFKPVYKITVIKLFTKVIIYKKKSKLVKY